MTRNNMKTYTLTLLLLCLSTVALAQGDDLFDEFKREPNAEYVSIPSFVTLLGKPFMGNDPDTRLAKKVKSVRVLDIEQCPPEVKRRFDRRVKALPKKGYETMVHVNDDGERLRIYARMKKDVVRELLIACSEEGECTLVQVKGRFSKKDIDRLVDEQTSHRDGRR